MLQLFKKWGFPINPETDTVTGIESCIEYFSKIESKRKALPYEIDGVVYKVNNFNLQQRMGKVTRAPRWAVARKFPAETGKTIINSISFQVGRLGSITPVADLEPVKVGGVTISNASLHNYDDIKKQDIRIGDNVWVQRAGDVIPQVIEVIKSKRKKNSKIIEIPNKCPICGSQAEKELLSEQNNQVNFEKYIRCTGGFSCSSQAKERLKHFVSKEAFDIDGFGEKLVNQLVDNKIVQTVDEIFKLTFQDLVNLERMAEKSAENIFNAIESSKQISFSRFIYSLGIRNVGSHLSKVIEKAFNGNIYNFINIFNSFRFFNLRNNWDSIFRVFVNYFM